MMARESVTLIELSSFSTTLFALPNSCRLVMAGVAKVHAAYNACHFRWYEIRKLLKEVW